MLLEGECPVKLDTQVVVGLKRKCLELMFSSSSCFTSLLLKWKTVETVLPSISFSCHCLRYRAKVLMSWLRVLSIIYYSWWAVKMAESVT